MNRTPTGILLRYLRKFVPEPALLGLSDRELLQRFAGVSRVGRDDDAAIRGYQRPEVLAHINAIRAYIESEAPLIPNGIVVAFDARVRFEAR